MPREFRPYRDVLCARAGGRPSRHRCAYSRRPFHTLSRPREHPAKIRARDARLSRSRQPRWSSAGDGKTSGCVLFEEAVLFRAERLLRWLPSARETEEQMCVVRLHVSYLFVSNPELPKLGLLRLSDEERDTGILAVHALFPSGGGFNW
jgi:hypothetical protein